MKIFYLIPFLFLTACTEQPTPTNLRTVEVELVQVDYGFRSLAVIWVKDADRGVTLRQEISCDDWNEEIDFEDDSVLEQYVLEGFNPESLPFFNQEKD